MAHILGSIGKKVNFHISKPKAKCIIKSILYYDSKERLFCHQCSLGILPRLAFPSTVISNLICLSSSRILECTYLQKYCSSEGRISAYKAEGESYGLSWVQQPFTASMLDLWAQQSSMTSVLNFWPNIGWEEAKRKGLTATAAEEWIIIGQLHLIQVPPRGGNFINM